MRPVQLILDSFGSFRGRHTVEFDGIDLFVLAGPTGAGKSTLLDAMTMALYGSVARYENANVIEPAINRLATQAAVSFTFELGGRRYVVTRLLRRTSAGGAHAAEVRLERVRADGTTTTLASGSREVNPAVVDLLGLNFDEFCKTVVLPQGAFAKFLHGGRTERQDLLVRLLGLEQYAEVGQAARARANALQTEIDGITTRLTRLDDVDQQAVDAASAWARRLQAARRNVVDELWPELESRRDAYGKAEQEHAVARANLETLERLTMPGGVDELADRVRSADDAVEVAGNALEVAERILEESRERLNGLADPTPLSNLLRLDEKLGVAIEEARKLAAEARDARTAADEAAKAVQSCEGAAAAAMAMLERQRRDHLAHSLAEGLDRGQDCPVCLRQIDDVPQHPTPPGLSEAEEMARREASGAESARTRASLAETAATVAEARAGDAERRTADLHDEMTSNAASAGVTLVDGRADRGRIEAELAEHERASAAARAAEGDVRKARQVLASRKQARADLDVDASAAWRAFDQVRDTVAAQGAPAPSERIDVAAAWKELLWWRDTALAEARRKLDDAKAALEDAKAAGHEQATLIRAVVREVGVEVAADVRPEQALDRLAGAASRADAKVQELVSKLAEADELRAERTQIESRRQVAELLGQLLRRDQFEQWLLNRLSTQLVAGASRVLNELTQGAFSLALEHERGAFEVVDHLNADERRSAKTLSGGETFLASLALALSLAEHVALVNATGAARLDALFLDEGFGSLDPETLETVASAIEDLSGSRVVGVITHVKELAARIPYRFEVWRGPDGSTIRPAAPDDAAPLADLTGVLEASR